MEKDERLTSLFADAEAAMRALRRPGTGQLSDAAEVSLAPDGGRIAFSGTLLDRLEGGFPTRICTTDVASGETRVLTFGPNTDRLPKFSPDGTRIAFLSDRARAGDFQLYLLDPLSGSARATPRVEGWVEYLHWSPDGKRILLGVAGHGADISGGQGAVTSNQTATGTATWMPRVETGDETYRWRRLWVYDLASETVRCVSSHEVNVWEASWSGPDAVAAVVSPGPGEGLWYTATLERIELTSGVRRSLYKPADQLGWPSASPSGKHVAVVDAFCSDRWVVAGELRIIDAASGAVERVATNGVDISCTEWRSDSVLLLAGHRGFETVVAIYDLESRTFTETWTSRETTTAGFHATVSGGGASRDCALVGEGFRRAPEIAIIRNGEYKVVRSLDPEYAQTAHYLGEIETLTWNARDGLEIQGYLLKPESAQTPHPVVTLVHGGPVANHRPRWLGRSLPIVLLLARGYAVFLPNPRGSSGRGQAFARKVLADCGGEEMHDHLSGLDHLVATGRADPKRLGVTGVSHGGYMSSWIITQDGRFAAAVPTAPVTNFFTEHLISNIPDFVRVFLQDSLTNTSGRYFTRSPIMFAHRVKTPTLNVCGLLDRCTPPEEAVQFHNALLENGVTSVLVSYPEEGHGVRKMPAMFDYAARLVAWFERFMPARANGTPFR
jgi:dipeptidyl aminopeptidase/acylaminoacyl peptidase